MQGEQIATATRRQLAIALTAVSCLVALMFVPAHADAANLTRHGHGHLVRGPVAVVATTVDNAGHYIRTNLAVTGQPKVSTRPGPRTSGMTHAVTGEAGRALVVPQGRGPPRGAS